MPVLAPLFFIALVLVVSYGVWLAWTIRGSVLNWWQTRKKGE